MCEYFSIFISGGFAENAFVTATLQSHFCPAIAYLCIFTIEKKVAVKWIINYLKWELICSLKLVFPNGVWMHLCANVLPWLSFPAIFGNQLGAWVGRLLIFQPIAMKHCCERLLNYVFSAVSSLLLFSRIPLLKWTQRLHYCVSECGW